MFFHFLSNRLRHLQVSSDSKISEITNELRLKTFEAERMQLVYTETCRNLEKANLENQQLLQQKEVSIRLCC